MANLLDTIQNNSAALQGTQASEMDQTQQLQGLLRAKTGKAIGTPGDTGQSNLGEQGAVAQTQQQLGQLTPQVGMQQQATDITQRKQELQQQQSMQQLQQTKQYQTVQNKVQVNNLLQQLSQEKQSMGAAQDQSKLEQTAFLLSMQDSKYLTDLQNAGRYQRLDNQANFTQQQQKLTIGNATQLLQQKLGTQDILSVNDADFKQAMANLSMSDAQQIANMETQDRATEAQMQSDLLQYTTKQQAAAANATTGAQGLQGLISGGLQGYNAYASSTPTTPATPAPASAPAKTGGV